ncbi:MAG: putative lipoprotein [Myxococcales bacterium]|nr:putative lipoprotein [Myxococcales bacterium]
MNRPPGFARLSFCVVLAAWLLPTSARAADPQPDPWFGRDKALHFGASALIANVGYADAALATEDVRVRLAVGGGLALTAGVAKELWDLSGHGDASFRDLTWDVVGTATGLAVAAAIDWSIGKLRGRRVNAH